MDDILLSVIIPTKDRYDVLFPILTSICNHVNDPAIEFVVQDNSRNNKQILDFIYNIKDSRIKYFYKHGDIDVVKNFNYAISNAKGKYILIIGDDDFINPYIMNIMNLINEKDISGLIYPRATYYWSDVKFTKEMDFFEPASIQIIKDPDLNLKKHLSKVELNNVLSSGGIYLFDLPALYHGIVKRSVVDEIYKKYDSYVLGPSPDMSLSIALALEIESYYFVNFPVSIAGASYNSAAGMGRRGTHNKSLEEIPTWLPKDMVTKWNPLIPRVWNGFTVYAQSIYLVLKCYNFDKSISYIRLYDKILKDNFRDIKYLRSLENFKKLQIVKRNLMILKNYLYNFVKGILMLLPSFFINIIINKHPSFLKIKHVKKIKNVEACMQWLKLEYKDSLGN
tara:strand:- start:1030 stop:2211 length:1182 start_codon:yes stop_codon:yes gene_type:complete